MDTRAKVLLVDDEPFILNAVAGVLRSGGFDVVTCEQWTGVANTVRSEKPDVILLDYNMPTLKGDNICTILKRNCQNDNAGMKIILFSSEPELDLVRIVSECGADGYIAKNTAGPDLLRKVDGLVGNASVAFA